MPVNPVHVEVTLMNSRLKETVSLLKEVRLNMRSDVDARVTKALDEAIALLESEDSLETRKSALWAIGEALRFIPAIKALIEELLK